MISARSNSGAGPSVTSALSFSGLDDCGLFGKRYEEGVSDERFPNLLFLAGCSLPEDIGVSLCMPVQTMLEDIA